MQADSGVSHLTYTPATSGWELRFLPAPRSPRPDSWGRPGAPLRRPPYLEFLRVVEVHAHGGHHPGLEKRGQDLLGDGVRHEVEVQGVPPVGRDGREGQHGELRPWISGHGPRLPDALRGDSLNQACYQIVPTGEDGGPERREDGGRGAGNADQPSLPVTWKRH